MKGNSETVTGFYSVMKGCVEQQVKITVNDDDDDYFKGKVVGVERIGVWIECYDDDTDMNAKIFIPFNIIRYFSILTEYEEDEDDDDE